MIVKMNILRLLGLSDDKEKIGVARPYSPPPPLGSDTPVILTCVPEGTRGCQEEIACMLR